MLLPSSFNIIDHPPMDKMGVTALATLLLCWMKGTQVPRPRRSMLMYILGAGFVVAPILTSFGNSYELQEAGKSVHGFYPIDGIKFAARNVLMLIPLHIGRRFLSTDNARALLLKAIPAAMLVYSLPMLLEIRISPQLHRWVYGYFPGDSFAQQIRGNGFRPVVFFPHGLSLAVFTGIAVVCAFVMIRARMRVFRLDSRLIGAYLSGLLVLCKSLGPMIYAGVFGPMVLFTRPRFWVKVGCAASLVVCAYPFLRDHDLAPTQIVSNIATAVSPQRNASLQVRLLNEGQLLDKAEQKPWFGWGGWSRNRVFDQWTGQDISVTDGGWIIYFGVYGWFGFLSFFGLLAAALFQAHQAMGKEVTPANIVRGGLALLLTIYVINSIPNATEEWLVFLLAGCISSAPRMRRKGSIQAAPAATEQRELALAK